MKKALVIGSGAGGCAAARELSRSFEVVILEQGEVFKPFTMKLETLDPLRKRGLFIDERMISLLYPQMRVAKSREGTDMVWGKCIGGSTALATGNIVRYDGDLKALGINLDEEFATLEKLVPHTRNHQQRWNETVRALFRAFEEEGFHPQVTPKAVNLETCIGCGRCVLGCPTKAKWTANRLLEDAPGSVELRQGFKVERVIIKDNRARAVEYRQGIHKKVEQADLIVLAAGGMETPVILEKSGIFTEAHLFGDPVICLAAPLEGARSDLGLPMPFIAQREGYILSPYFDFLSFFFNKHWRLPRHDIVSLMVKYEDEEVGARSEHNFSLGPTPVDMEKIERALGDCMAIFKHLNIAPEDTFVGTLNAGHPGGTLPLTKQEAESLHSDRLPENLYVADATLLPHSMGNPPILTIAALAMAVAKKASAHLGVSS